jgi:hypothetical protein
MNNSCTIYQLLECEWMLILDYKRVYLLLQFFFSIQMPCMAYYDRVIFLPFYCLYITFFQFNSINNVMKLKIVRKNSIYLLSFWVIDGIKNLQRKVIVMYIFSWSPYVCWLSEWIVVRLHRHSFYHSQVIKIVIKRLM